MSRFHKLLIVAALVGLLALAAAANPGVGKDLNGDGIFNLLDVALFAQLYNSGVYQPSIDFNCDGVINLSDLVIFAS